MSGCFFLKHGVLLYWTWLSFDFEDVWPWALTWLYRTVHLLEYTSTSLLYGGIAAAELNAVYFKPY